MVLKAVVPQIELYNMYWVNNVTTLSHDIGVRQHASSLEGKEQKKKGKKKKRKKKKVLSFKFESIF